MAADTLTQLAMQYFSEMDDKRAHDVIAYMEQLHVHDETYKKRSLSDLKGKIHSADDYDYKAMRQGQ